MYLDWLQSLYTQMWHLYKRNCPVLKGVINSGVPPMNEFHCIYIGHCRVWYPQLTEQWWWQVYSFHHMTFSKITSYTVDT